MKPKLLAASIMCCMAATAFAYDFEVDGIYYNIISDSEVEVTEGRDYIFLKEIGVPEQVTHSGKTYNVTKIGDGAFSYCFELTSVSLPQNITIIGICAFENCPKLTAIQIPQNVTVIDSSAFAHCENLTDINIPENIKYIGAYAFHDTHFDDSLPEGPTYFGNILYTYKQTDAVPTAFSYTVKEGTTMIAGGAFADKNLDSIEIPNSVTEIGENAFYGCQALNAIMIPESVKKIGSSAFGACYNLSSIDIPDSIEEIGAHAVDETEYYSNLPDGLIYFGTILYHYKGTMPEGTSIVVKDGTTTIAHRAFAYCNGLTSISIPESVTKIDDGAFLFCESLTSITIPNSVTNMGLSIFSGCKALTSIKMPDNISNIYMDDMFYECEALTSIVVPDGVTRIGYGAFNGCTSLASISLPNSLKTIDSNAFVGCSSLTHIDIPEGVKTIGKEAFSDCTQLSSIDLPDSLIEVWNNAFNSTPFYMNQPEGLIYFGKTLYKYKGTMPENTSIIVNDGTAMISGNAFRNCTGLTSIQLPSSLTVIDSGAFKRCMGLTSIDIPDSIKHIGSDETFTGCTHLTDLYCRSKYPPYANEYIFDGVPTESCRLHVPENSVEYYSNSDGWQLFQNIVGDAAGIEDVTTADGPAEYFDLQGRKVTDPANGIFIKKQGNSTKKVLL